MTTIEKSIIVNVPVSTAYNQWTQFEEFPWFMDGIKHVAPIDEKHLHWKAVIGGQEKEWEAEITEQMPDQRIAWTCRDGPMKGGIVTFQALPDAKAEITLQIAYDPEGLIEYVGNAAGLMSLRVRGDLERFKTFIENRSRVAKGW
jgi:uncharacterized membrane protein